MIVFEKKVFLIVAVCKLYLQIYKYYYKYGKVGNELKY